MIKQSMNSIKVMITCVTKPVILHLLLLLLTAVFTPLSMLFTQYLIDAINDYFRQNGSIHTIVLWSILLVSVLFFLAINAFLGNIIQIYLRRGINRNITPEIIRKFKNIEYSYFESQIMHDTIHNMSNDPQYKILEVFLIVTNIMGNIITMIGTGLVFLQISAWFSIGMVGFFIPMIWSDCHAMSMLNSLYNSQSLRERKLLYFIQTLSNKHALMEYRVFKFLPFLNRKIDILLREIQKERFTLTVKTQKYMIFSSLLFKAWTAFIILYMVFAIRSGIIQLGLFVSVITATEVIIRTIDTLSFSFASLTRRYRDIEHFNKFMSLPEVKTPNTVSVLEEIPCIRFENVIFHYPESEAPILNNISFKIMPGENVALVGKNGAGKTTIIKLLCGLYKPTMGKITIGGVDIAGLSREMLRTQISVVYQDYANYFLTLRENVAFGNISKIDDDACLIRALRKGMGEKLLTMTDRGLDMNLGPLEADGVDLSGGQWQRIAISRACTAESRFIILDEPTAALDPVAESQMYISFQNIMKTNHNGSILITHRLAGAKMSDRILVLDEGRLVETGSHDTLMEKRGLYQKMFEMQSSWY
jgi:ABC-type multidrug transport system fused ATPase/permease subunit